jgi:hypothetical protein
MIYYVSDYSVYGLGEVVGGGKRLWAKWKYRVIIRKNLFVESQYFSRKTAGDISQQTHNHIATTALAAE